MKRSIFLNSSAERRGGGNVLQSSQSKKGEGRGKPRAPNPFSERRENRTYYRSRIVPKKERVPERETQQAQAT